jgi:fermentation-respiration switch protein FrsA (DUF1100 family)
MKTSVQTFTTKEVSFKSNGLKIAAVLFTPESAAEPTAALVVGHPGSGVKEQTAGIYARLFAENGFIALTFDAAHQGASEGTPRGLEDPRQRIEDFKCAVSYLHTVDLVDKDKIGIFGMCAGGGYSLSATASDHRVKAVATVIAADIARQFKKGGNGNQDPAVFQQLLQLANTDRTSEAKGNEPGTFPLFPTKVEDTKKLSEHDYEGWEYYCTPRGQHPRSAKFLTWNSVDRIAVFDAFAFVDLISPRPLLMISGSKAVTLWMTQEAFAAAKEPKELFVIDGANHMALYDNMQYVSQAVDRAVEFFRKNLNVS